MTLYRNANVGNYGISCGRHKTAAELENEAPVDKHSARYLALRAGGDKNARGLALAEIVGRTPRRPGDMEGADCAHCARHPSAYRVTVIGALLMLQRVALCRDCYGGVRALLKSGPVTLVALYNHLRAQ